MLAVNWANEQLDGILEAWYPGQNGGAAVADILFGRYNPAGRLPVTFYKSLNDLPEFEDYSMKGRTYRYFKGKVLYPFGYGLSYARFSYSDMRLSDPSMTASDSLTVYVKVKNDSKIAGDEVVQLYGTADNIPQYRPVKTLVGFKRIHLKAGEVKEVALRVAAASLREYDVQKGEYTVYKGNYKLFAGGSSADQAQMANLSIQ